MIEYRLPAWGLSGPRYSEIRSSLFLIATELVTNAVDETPDQPIRVSCTWQHTTRTIHFAVWDSSDKKPEATMPHLDLETLDLSPEHFDDNGGWGLPLVQALSADCGITPTAPGKWVWATLKVDV